jgi:GT2 family glycosyltransferase
MKPRLSISIVLYRTAVADIRACMESLARYPGPTAVHVIDNSPTDALRSEFADGQVSYVHLPHNPGFGAGHNVGIAMGRVAGANDHLVLNADVQFASDVLSPLIAFMDEHPDVAHVMPLVRNPDGSIQRLCKLVPTPANLLFRRFLPRRARDARNRHFELHESGYDRRMFIPYLSGCFMLLRHAALEEAGTFDERFFMYAEDIDLTRRLASRYETLFVPDVSVVHGHGAASRKSLRMFLVHAANVARYFNKWGWLRDPERDRLNARTLSQFR